MPFPNNWYLRALREVTIPTATWNPRADPRERIRYVDVSAVDRQTLRIIAEATYSTANAPSRARKVVQAGDTIFATVRPRLRRIARISKALDGEIVSTAFCVLRPDPTQVDPRFLFFATQVESFVSGIATLEKGASYPAVRDTDVLDQIVAVPPLVEQQDIAAVLELTRSAILTECECEVRAGALKEVAMRALFTRGLRGEVRDDAKIGLVPQNWNVGPIGAFAQFQRGFDITKGEQVDGSVPVVSSGGIKSYHNKAAAHGPGVLIGRKGSIGLLHYVDTDYWPHDTTLWCSDFLGNTPKFVFYRLHTLDMKRLDSGATNPALNRNFLHKELISWPPPDEQREIVAILDSIDSKIHLHQRKRAALEDLFDSLLHKLMTGEIRVADLALSALTEASAAEVAA